MTCPDLDEGLIILVLEFALAYERSSSVAESAARMLSVLFLFLILGQDGSCQCRDPVLLCLVPFGARIAGNEVCLCSPSSLQPSRNLISEIRSAFRNVSNLPPTLPSSFQESPRVESS